MQNDLIHACMDPILFGGVSVFRDKISQPFPIISSDSTNHHCVPESAMTSLIITVSTPPGYLCILLICELPRHPFIHPTAFGLGSWRLQLMEVVAEIVIVGAGLGGLATALGLHRVGLRCLVLESSDTLRTSGFALSTWSNAWRVFVALGVGDSLRKHHVRLERFITYSASSGYVTSKLELKQHGQWLNHEVRCSKRNLIVETLAKDLPDGTIRYSSKVISIEEMGKLKLLHLADGSTVKAKVLIGCDGINSIVARWLGLKAPTFTGRYASRGFATFPEGHGFNPEFAQYNGDGCRVGMLPTDEQSIYWFFTWTPDANEEEATDDYAKVRKYVVNRLKTTKVPEEWIRVVEKSEPSSVACSPLRHRSPFDLLGGNIAKGNVCVVGDAFHPMTPDIGQGGCSALEDGVILAKCLREAVPDVGRTAGGGGGGDEHDRIEAALKKYADQRKWRCFELVATSYLVGIVQGGKGVFGGFLRDRCLAQPLTWKLFVATTFDCGNL